MKLLKGLLPETSGSGGTRVGSGFLDDWKICPYNWYTRHLAPHPDGGYGSDFRLTPDPLWLGGVAASALAAWRLADFSAEAGAAALDAEATRRASEVGLEDHWAELYAEVTKFMVRFFRHASSGPDADSLHYRLISVSGEPLVEREFEIDLGFEGYFYTIKPDAVVERLSDGYICALDDKTTSASFKSATILQKSKTSQFTAEQYAVATAWPDHSSGMIGNFIVKDAAASKPCRDLRNMDRPPERLELFRIHTIRLLKDIERHVEEYLALCATGLDEPLAARAVFSDEPTEGSCVRYNRACSNLNSCIEAKPSLISQAHLTKPRYPGSVKKES